MWQWITIVVIYERMCYTKDININRKVVINMDQEIKNQKAIEEVELDYGKSIRESCQERSNEVVGYLRLCGLVCSVCSGYVTAPNFEFCGYSKNVKCYDCQNK